MRMPVEIGDDGNTWMWECPSFSDSKVRYEIHVNRNDGSMWCSCMDAVCRKKNGTIVSENLCKHCKYLLRLLKIREPNKWNL